MLQERPPHGNPGNQKNKRGPGAKTRDAKTKKETKSDALWPLQDSRIQARKESMDNVLQRDGSDWLYWGLPIR